MQTESIQLGGDSAGTRRELAVFRYGQPGRGPKVYVQTALHADEMPGVLAVQHLLGLLDVAQIKGEILVVPIANPIGLAQWAYQKPFGRFEMDRSENFNRHYPDLAELAGDAIAGKLTQSATDNLRLIREAFAATLAGIEALSDLQQLRLTLMKLSCDADYVLDLHCDTEGVMHHYATPARSDDSELLGRCIGSRLALINEVSGGNAFDEAHSAPWSALKRRFGDRFPIPDGCFSTTVEYRGQLDVDDETAAGDAENLMTFLACIGAVEGKAEPKFPAAVAYPLGGYVEVHSPQGGVISWKKAVGSWVRAGEILCEVTEPMTRKRVAVTAPIDGLMFRRELYRQCLRGHGLCHVAGDKAIRGGNLLSD